MGRQVHNVATRKAHEVSECPLKTAAKVKGLVVLNLEFSELLNDPAEGHFPTVELDKPDALDDFTRYLDSFILEHVDFLDE